MVSTTIMKKHLLLLNRLHKQQLKKELIPTPTKLSKEEITKYFNSLFTQKDNYYIPKLSTELKLNEADFKAIAPKKYEKKPVEKKPVEIKKAEATKENLPQEMKAKKIKIELPKLQTAQKVNIKRPEMKKAESMKDNLKIMISDKKERPKTAKEQEEEDTYFEKYFKSFEPGMRSILAKGNPNKRNLIQSRLIEEMEKDNKKSEKSILEGEKILKTATDKSTIKILKMDDERLKEKIKENLKKIEKIKKEGVKKLSYKNLYDEMTTVSNYKFYPYVADIKEIDNGEYYRGFVRYITRQRDNAKNQMKKINLTVLLDHL
jgi:hypothetical protein